MSKKRTHHSVYRKIYKQYYGDIPKDASGRSYEIHHIDGDHNNNDPSNLKAVTIQEHYDIHYNQGDWSACRLISMKMALTPKEISDLARLSNKQRVENGTHNFLGDSCPVHAQIKNGTHNLTSELRRRVARERVENGTHHLLSGEIQKKSANERVKNGTHNLLGENNPRFDHTIYTFWHKDLNITEVVTRSALVKKYGVSEQSLSKMVKGKRKSANGWTILISTA